MNLIVKGKTKDVYELDFNSYLLKFKDELTGTDGVFDPGADTVGLKLKGAGKSALRLSKFFFELLQKKGIPTHYICSHLEQSAMEVKRALPFGQGLEVICRYRAVGSFYRRYGLYLQEGTPLDGFVEFTLKDDQRGDPPIGREALLILKILTAEEYGLLRELTLKISGIVKEALAQKGIELYDIKLEFGRLAETGQIALIDEISGGTLRAYDRGVYLPPLELARKICGDS